MWFDHGSGLTTSEGTLTGFEVAAKNGPFVTAKATIEGDTVLVQSEQWRTRSQCVTDGDSPECRLFNSAGLPASPFARLPIDPGQRLMHSRFRLSHDPRRHAAIVLHNCSLERINESAVHLPRQVEDHLFINQEPFGAIPDENRLPPSAGKSISYS